MKNPIIEKLQALIQDKRTADHFSEVLGCYYAGNLRSAIVMLYATVICDLVYKLEDLKTLYNDKGAAKILDDLEKQQKANLKNTDWEKKVPEECMIKHKILSAADYSNFCSLQQLRHLCAHPVIANNNELYKPNSDIVLGHIRNMLDGILIKPAFQTKELFTILLDDLSSVKDIIVDEKKLEKYVESKYLDKFNSVELEMKLFKNLWKFVFALDNEECNANRYVNYSVLTLLIRRHTDNVLEFFAKEQNYFASQITVKMSDSFCLLIKLFNEFPNIFSELPEATQLEINAVIDKDAHHEYKALSLFRCADIVEHIMNKTLRCCHDNLKYFASILEENVGHSIVLDYYVNVYEASGNFDKADSRFEDFIKPYITEFSEEQVLHLLDATENNGQIYARWKAKESNRIIKDRMQALNPDFDFRQYKHME